MALNGLQCRLQMTRNLAFFVVLLVSSSAFGSAAAAQDPIRIANAWAREAPLSAGVSAVYLSLVNTQPHDDTLLSVTTSAAKRAEVHETSIDDGIAHMRPIPALRIPANSTVSLSPAGKHIMLLELARPLRRGSTLTLSLSFAHAGQIRAVVPVFVSGEVATNVRQPAATHNEH